MQIKKSELCIKLKAIARLIKDLNTKRPSNDLNAVYKEIALIHNTVDNEIIND